MANNQSNTNISTLNPINIKEFNKQTTNTGLFDTTAGGTDIGSFNELSPLRNKMYASYGNGFNSYPKRTVSELVTKITMFLGIFLI